MREAADNEKCKEYKNYGARGITVYPEWIDSFENFYKHIGERPSKNHSLERIDNNLNHTDENTVLVTDDGYELLTICQ